MAEPDSPTTTQSDAEEEPLVFDIRANNFRAHGGLGLAFHAPSPRETVLRVRSVLDGLDAGYIASWNRRQLEGHPRCHQAPLQPRGGGAAAARRPARRRCLLRRRRQRQRGGHPRRDPLAHQHVVQSPHRPWRSQASRGSGDPSPERPGRIGCVLGGTRRPRCGRRRARRSGAHSGRRRWSPRRRDAAGGAPRRRGPARGRHSAGQRHEAHSARGGRSDARQEASPRRLPLPGELVGPQLVLRGEFAGEFVIGDCEPAPGRQHAGEPRGCWASFYPVSVGSRTGPGSRFSGAWKRLRGWTVLH
mmetsp:Transcript_27137/g.84423  ORF Transcript_27137/g.84423 Transcript_27137/m.84423 type:complete len:303 (+) Transcript_27137:61-969(+)